MKTDEMIKALAADTKFRKAPPGMVFGVALVIALVVGAVELFSTIGVRPDFSTAIETLRYPLKVVITGTLLVTSLVYLVELARPGADTRLGEVLIQIAPLMMGAAVAYELWTIPPDQWTTLQIGTRSRVCLTLIPLFGLLPLAFFILVLRYMAPMRPVLAGAVAGLVAGGISASYYALHCDNDSPLFVGTWYTLGILILVTIGAIVTPRIARW